MSSSAILLPLGEGRLTGATLVVPGIPDKVIIRILRGMKAFESSKLFIIIFSKSRCPIQYGVEVK